MQKHEYFEELCALARIGQLSVSEHAELLQHLKVCDSCRRVGDDFAVILDRLPVAEAEISTSSLDCLQTESYRARFLRRAQTEGVGFTPQALNAKQRLATRPLRLVYALAPAVAVVLAVAIIIADPAVLSRFHGRGGQERVNPSQPLAAPVPPVANAAANAPVSHTPDPALAALQGRYAAAQREIQRLNEQLAQAMRRTETPTDQEQNQAQFVAQLQARISEYEQSLAKTSVDLDRLRSEKERTASALVADEVRVGELTDQLRSRDAAVEQERQLSVAAQDVREMMGARNLHMIDVFDADGRGRSRKSFGRVFYVEGKSLIFYAFDLAQKGAGDAKVSFQAWGQREASKEFARNLGVFYIDDHAQKRWVLKVNDPEKLRAIDSVFVTVERFGGVDRPTGQKLLYAFLGSQANHP